MRWTFEPTEQALRYLRECEELTGQQFFNMMEGRDLESWFTNSDPPHARWRAFKALYWRQGIPLRKVVAVDRGAYRKAATFTMEYAQAEKTKERCAQILAVCDRWDAELGGAPLSFPAATAKRGKPRGAKTHDDRRWHELMRELIVAGHASGVRHAARIVDQQNAVPPRSALPASRIRRLCNGYRDTGFSDGAD
jgi:hypothetical protein